MSWLVRLHDAGVPMLTLAWLVPLILAALVTRLGGRRLPVFAALASSAAMLAMSLESVRALGLGDEHGWMLEDRLAIGPWTYHVGLDGLGAVFLTLLNLVTLLVTLHAWVAAKTRPQAWFAWQFVLQASLAGMLVSLDLVLFAAFAVLEILPTRAIVRGWGTGEGLDEVANLATRFLALSVGLWLAGAGVLAWQTGVGTDLVALRGVTVASPWADVAFFLMLYALAVRLPLFPFHGWLPPVVEHGPVAGLPVFLLGVKVGAFGLVRFVLPLFPGPSLHWGFAITALGFFGMFYGALVAMAQEDFRKILAYAALSHMGFVVPSLFSLNESGMTGALLETLNLGIVSVGLFFVVGFLWLRRGTTRVDDLHGVAGSVPLLAGSFLLLTLASLGMPGTSGSEGVHLILEGAIETGHYRSAVAVGVGTVLGGLALLMAYGKLLPGHDDAHVELPDLGIRELAIIGSVCALILAAGVYTEPWEEAVGPPARAIAEQAAAFRSSHDGPSDVIQAEVTP